MRARARVAICILAAWLLACGAGDDLTGDQQVCGAVGGVLDRLAGADDPATVSAALEGFRQVADEASEADLQQASQRLLVAADDLGKDNTTGVGPDVATAIFEVTAACDVIGHPVLGED